MDCESNVQLPYNFPLAIYQDQTLVQQFLYSTIISGIKTPVDLTGWAAKLQIKADYNSTAVVTVDSDGSGTDGAIELTDDGYITVTISSATTEALTIKSGVYDLRLTKPDSTSFYLVKGLVTVSPTVTK